MSIARENEEIDRLIGALCLEDPFGSVALLERGAPALERILQVVCGESRIALPLECDGRAYSDNVPGMITLFAQQIPEQVAAAVQCNNRLRNGLVRWALGLVDDARISELLTQSGRRNARKRSTASKKE